jgi:hypothetical protein
VTTIVQKALDTLKKAGAELNDISVPGYDELLRDSSMINSDFKFDLADYLATAEDPPVKSLGEILDRGLFHAALEATFRLRNAVEQRETDASRRARIKRTAIRQAVEAVLAEHRLDALVYPTLRRKPARIGDAQGGTNCQLSAHSGLPALGLPAGFTDDGVPIGIDLLGNAFNEQELLSLGHAIEQVLNVRRRPFSTPAIVNGQRPSPRMTTAMLRAPESTAASPRAASATVSLIYDESTSRLQFALKTDPAGAERLASIWIHSGTVEKPGAARHQLYATGQPASGFVTLSAADRQDLADGRLLVRFFLKNGRGSAADVPVLFAK